MGNIVDSDYIRKRHRRCIRYLFSDREGTSSAGSDPGFRQITEFHTGAAWLKRIWQTNQMLASRLRRHLHVTQYEVPAIGRNQGGTADISSLLRFTSVVGIFYFYAHSCAISSVPVFATGNQEKGEKRDEHERNQRVLSGRP